MNKYNDILTNQIWASVFVLVIILVLAIVVFILNKKHFFNDLGKIGKTAVTIFVVAVIFLGSFHFFVRIFHLYKDIHQQAYITYHGDFEVSSFKEGYVTLISESGDIKLDGRVELPGGEYTGTIVYAKNSKRILKWDVD